MATTLASLTISPVFKITEPDMLEEIEQHTGEQHTGTVDWQS